MTTATLGAYGALVEPASVRLERLLPGPIDRVWSYLTDSDLRARWLAAGRMEPTPGARVELVWRNDELSGKDEQRPDGFSAEQRMDCAVVRIEAPRLLVLSWGASGSEVSFELEPRGAEVRLVLTHRRAPSRDMLLSVAAGWHAHLDLLAAVLASTDRPLFWANWQRLKVEYDTRLT
jgi:uncharacterized protein YndB with AHSA1/START domain